jgi:flagellin
MLNISSLTDSASSLFAQNALRANSLLVTQKMGQLSSGNKLVSAGISPSDLAISASFKAQIGGIEQATYNVQDAGSMVNTADATLANQGDVLGRMRDIAVRSANDATLTDADRTRLNSEYQSLNTELTRSGEAATFNTKQLTSQANPYGTQAVQATPDNQPAANPTVTINSSTANTLNTDVTDVTTGGNARKAIDVIDTAMKDVANQRANLGSTANVLQNTENDLATQSINMSAANSRIADTEFASTISDLTKGILLDKLGIAMLSQAHNQSKGVLNLLGT